MYQISDYTKNIAKSLNLDIKPSTNSKKKIDVYKKGEKIASIGASGMGDYPTYLKTRGKTYADERRRLYHLRHKKDAGIAGKLAKTLLW
jgi:hypothetical protein